MSKRTTRNLDRRSLRRALNATDMAGRVSTTKLIKSGYGMGAKASNLRDKTTRDEGDDA